MEIFIPTVANNKYTKKQGSGFLMYSVDSNQRLCCITPWLRSCLMVTINRQLWQGAMETAHHLRTVNPQSNRALHLEAEIMAKELAGAYMSREQVFEW